MTGETTPSNLQTTLSTDNKFTPTELLWKYLSYLPFFIISLSICIAVGVIYLRYTQPVYKANTGVLVKSNTDNRVGGSTRGGNGGDLIESAMSSSKMVNLDNEIVMITTRPLIQRVVKDHHFNDYYLQEGSFKSSEIYTNCPFEVADAHWADSTGNTQFFISHLNAMGGVIQSDKKDNSTTPFKWDQVIDFKGNKFKIIFRNTNLMAKQPGNLGSKEVVYSFVKKPISTTVEEIAGNLKASPYSAKTTIILLDLKGANSNKAAAILNGIVEEYNRQSIEDKSIVLNNTIQFINQRLDFVTKELGVVETDLKDFKNTNQVIDLPAQSGQALSDKASVEQEYTKLGIQEKLFHMVSQQIRQMPVDHLQIIPVNVAEGIQKTGAFELYNTLVLKKLREEPFLGKNSPVLADLTAQVQNAYAVVLQSLTEQEQALNFQKKALLERIKKFESLVGEVPANEKTLVEIKRQQNVKEGLYLYLLQKREESAISNSYTASNYQQLEPAKGSGSPIEPNSQRIYIFSLIIGLIIPVAFIYLLDLFDDKIRTREDITSRTKMPIIAEIGHISDLAHNLMVAAKSRNISAEQFRILRTNLHFLLQDKSSIMVTSTESAEGKSFIALNLAAVLSISGKKVALIEFDLRKPSIIRNIGLQKKNIGISNFLAKQTDDLEELSYTLDNYPSLHIYGCGPIPPKPAELMLGERIELLFQQLKQQYDYIIVDTPPVGLVGDAFNLTAYVDTSLFVVRQSKTLKKQLFFINDLYTSKQLKNAGMVINDVKLGARNGYYGHHYGNGYGYGENKKAYGSYFDQDKKKKSFKESLSKVFG